MRNKKLYKQNGFTIIELLIATTIFSVIILVVTVGIIRIGNMYYKNITSARTQNVTRDIVNDVTGDIQTASYIDPSPGSYCIGNTLYTYFLGVKYVKGNEFSSGIYSTEINPGFDCTTAVGCPVGACKNQQQLLGNNMRVKIFDIDDSATPGLFKVKLAVIYGDDDLLTNYDNSGNPNGQALDTAECKNGITGSNFCSTATLETIIKRVL